jgi:hypothetical protein
MAKSNEAKFDKNGKKIKVGKRGWSPRMLEKSMLRNAKRRGLPAKLITKEVVLKHHKARDTVYAALDLIEKAWQRDQKKTNLPAVVEQPTVQ